MGFAVEMGTPASLTATLVGPAAIRPGSLNEYCVFVVNSGNTDAGPTDVRIQYSKYLGVDVNSPTHDTVVGQNSVSMGVSFPNVPAGSTVTVPLTVAAPSNIGPHVPFNFAAWANPNAAGQVLYIGDLTEPLVMRTKSPQGYTVDYVGEMVGGRVSRLAEFDIRSSDGTVTGLQINNYVQPIHLFNSAGADVKWTWTSATTATVTATQPGVVAPDIYQVIVPNGTATSPPIAPLPGVSLVGVLEWVAGNLKTGGEYWEYSGVATKVAFGILIAATTSLLAPEEIAGFALLEIAKIYGEGLFLDYLLQEQLFPRLTVLLGETRTANDPNDLAGPLGYGTAQWVNTRPLTYDAMFENVPTASAPAATVVVTDHIDATKFDTTSVQIGTITVAGHSVTPTIEYALPIGTKKYDADIPMPDKNVICRIHCELDTLTGDLTWTFQSIDPVTNKPVDDLRGFLDKGEEGSCLFSVTPKAGLPTGTVITNQATIVFDYNAPMNTPVWSNTIDNDAPVTAIKKLAATQTSRTFKLNLVTPNPPDLGSGMKDYAVYFSTDGKNFTLAPGLENVTAAAVTFVAPRDGKYWFYSRGRDNAENVEPAPAIPDAVTTVQLCVDTVTVAPSPIAGGLAATGTVTLTGPALTSGAVVALASNNAAAGVPPTITVAAGATTATFAIATTPASAPISATITASWSATLPKVTKSAKLTVRPMGVTSVTLNPTSVKGGLDSTATITLEAAAGPSFIPITLSSSASTVARFVDGAGNAISSVLVPLGQTSVNVTLRTSPVTTTRKVTLRVAANGLTKSAVLTVTK